MLVKGPTTFRSSLKIATQETPLKAFSTPTYITTQSGFKSGRALMPKRMVLQLPRIETPKLMGDRCF
jgi:hypothetical protein